MEEATEFLSRLNNQGTLPMITSCCPAWVRYVEEIKPELLSNLSSTRSPQQIMGRLIKNYITSSAGQKPENVFVVSIVPCTAKKYEADCDRMKDGSARYVDAVITIRELSRIIRLMGIDFSGLEPEPSDTAFGMRSSAGNLFGVSGGHLEGLIRTIQHMATGLDTNSFKITELRGLKSKKEARVKIGKQMIRAVAVNGLANAKAMAEEVVSGREDYQLIEVMACPFGCINGGGQKLNSDEKNLKTRMKFLYDVDDEEMIKVAHKNPIINDLYEKFLTRPGTSVKNDLLHISRNNPELQ
jgi:NADH-quinone oxidoreductase subunit G/NADP-reducing hydrogenase subunit HndD